MVQKQIEINPFMALNRTIHESGYVKSTLVDTQPARAIDLYKEATRITIPIA